MGRLLRFAALATTLACSNAWAIEDETSPPTYNTNVPTSSNIPNWSTGWTQPAVQPAGFTYTTGWNYIGTVNGSSATYLGNGWVITAAHVGAGNLSLGTSGYAMVPGSTQQLTTTYTPSGSTTPTTAPADLIVFQVSPAPALPPLLLSTTLPAPYSTQAAMLGWGDGSGNRALTWGYNTVTEINQEIALSGTSYVSYDLLTLTGLSSNGSQSATNVYQTIIGDSGGGDFVYNHTSKMWELTGINEADGSVTYGNGSTQQFSGSVQIETYAAQIEKIITPVPDTPTMPAGALFVLGAVLILCAAPTLTRKLSISRQI